MGEDMIVVGGGDAAVEEACFLTKFANTVYLVHRRENFRAEKIWQDKLHEKVEDGAIELVLNSDVQEIHGTPEDGVDSVTVVTNPDGHPMQNLSESGTTSQEFDVSAVFIAVGHIPNTDFLAGTSAQLDDDGYVWIAPARAGNQTEISPGFFAAGDVVDFHYQQAVTAAGMGVKAALDADHYLSNHLD